MPSWQEAMEYLSKLLEHLTNLGPIGGIILTMIESIFPPLPLVVFVTANVAAFGFLFGYIYSVIGTILGNILVFMAIRRWGKDRILKHIYKRPRLKNILLWIKRKGFTPVFVLYTFPFSPSILVCGLASLSDMKRRDYIWAAVMGKMIMVLSLSFIGYNVKSFVEQPIKSILFIVGTLSVSYIGRHAIGRYEKHLDKKHGHLTVEDVLDHKNDK